MAFANAAITDIIATVIQSRSGIVADNVTNNNALLNYLNRRGNYKTVSGGNVIMQELSFAANGNAAWFAGYETLPVAVQNVISAAQFNYKQAACPVVISGLEQLQNAGRERIIDLMESRIAVAESSMSNLISAGIYSDGLGVGGRQLDGLASYVSTAPTTGTVGGIDRATWPFWRNVSSQVTGTTTANIQERMNAVWAQLVRGRDRPDLIVMDNNFWSIFTNSLQLIQRFTTSADAQLGFVSMKFMDADVILDGGLQFTGLPGSGSPANRAYFLNTRYLHFRPHRDRNMVPLSPGMRHSINQDAAVQILGWAGNLTMSGARFQGVLWQ